MKIKFKDWPQYLEAIHDPVKLYSVLKSNYRGYTVLINERFIGRMVLEIMLGEFDHTSIIEKYSLLDSVSGFLRSDFCYRIHVIVGSEPGGGWRTLPTASFERPVADPRIISILERISGTTLRDMFESEVKRCEMWPLINEGVFGKFKFRIIRHIYSPHKKARSFYDSFIMYPDFPIVDRVVHDYIIERVLNPNNEPFELIDEQHEDSERFKKFCEVRSKRNRPTKGKRKK